MNPVKTAAMTLVGDAAPFPTIPPVSPRIPQRFSQRAAGHVSAEILDAARRAGEGGRVMIAAISARTSNSTPWRGAAEAAVRPQQDAPAVVPSTRLDT